MADLENSRVENQQLNQQLIRENPTESEVELIRHSEEVSTGKKILHALDIFSFLPVPRTNPISTKRSICGSFLLLFIFFGYIIYSLVSFFVANYPRMNLYSVPLPSDEQVPVPKFAFGFVYGDDLDTTEYNLRYFSFKFEMIVKQAGKPDEKENSIFSPDNCGDLDWIGSPYNNKEKFQLFCPDPSKNSKYFMQGLLYASPKQVYPRITVTYCNTLTSLLFCVDSTELQKITSGGRLYLFTQQPESINYATGQKTTGKSNFNLNYYFLVPGDYNRAELVMGLTQTTQFPDYLTSFSKTDTQSVDISTQNFYLSDVTYFNPSSAFQIWLRLNDSVNHVDIVYDTIIDKVSQWGALWGVLFAAFAFYFLKYNTNKFYQKNQDWAEFDKGMQKVDKIQTVQNVEQRYQGTQYAEESVSRRSVQQQ